MQPSSYSSEIGARSKDTGSHKIQGGRKIQGMDSGDPHPFFLDWACLSSSRVKDEDRLHLEAKQKLSLNSCIMGGIKYVLSGQISLNSTDS